ncbi:PAS domain-containing sensor histidine kinase [Nocardioides sp. URHA0020]|uniref:PAS domain-containing sensor histidine kinase n=1 Tax=Nocardioides sp. URHA0020 TaxID=1380392 RepID=UPI0006858310|nr:PAS domain-containing sensor histidine kinase [Nocardioides sp. URHA0020]
MEGAVERADPWLLTLQHSPIGMAMVGLDGRLLMANLAMSEMLGYGVEELTARGFQELTHPDDLDADLTQFERALAGEIDSYRLRKRFLHAEGHVVWGDLSVALVRGPDREPLHFISQILDITAAERERQSMEAVFETVSVGLLLIGRDGRYERMNRRHQETMHLPFPDGHEGTAGQLGHVYHPDGHTLMAREDMPSYRATQGEEFDDYTYWVGDDPLTRRAFSTSARQVRGPSGERLGAALAYQEITELMRAMKVKDEFISSVSHELRTPLTSVLGYLELLRDNQSLSPAVRTQIQVVERNAVRLLALVSDLLEVGQVEEGGLRLLYAEADLVAIVADAAEAARRVAATADIEVRVDQPERLVARVDQQRIRQVVDNLLSNAVKYSTAGGTVTVALRRAGDDTVLEVSDTGIGIAPDEVDQVFGRFFRGGGALEQQIPGTGLGLDIVSSIVAAHGGVVSLESELGRGSTFRVTLPAGGGGFEARA